EETARQRDEAVQKLPHQDEIQRLPTEKQRAIYEQARNNVPPVVKTIPPGYLLVERNFPITDSQYELLQKETRAFLQSQSRVYRISRTIAIFLVFTLLALLVVLYVIRFQQGLASGLHKVVGVCALVLLTLVIGLFLCPVCWHAVL